MSDLVTEKISISTGAILLIAVLYFFDSTGVLSAFVPAIAAHEIGHALALRAQGAEIRNLALDVTGLRMDYSGYVGTAGEFIAAVCGPLAGIAFAYAASFVGNVIRSEYLLCAAGLSIALSIFNLLPAMPLDGGRCLRAVCGRNADTVLIMTSTITAVVLIIIGVRLLYKGYGAGLMVAGMWIALELLK